MNKISMKSKFPRNEAGWRKVLSQEQFRILRMKGTEIAFTGKYWNHHETGVYCCAGCGQPLFSSDSKFESGTGWPSFLEPISKDAISLVEDRSLSMVRTEIHCSRCGGHLGHLFNDGPAPNRLRYCSNSPALAFQKQGKQRR